MELSEVRYRQRSHGERPFAGTKIASIVLTTDGTFLARSGDELTTGRTVVIDHIPVRDAHKIESESERGENSTLHKYVVPYENEQGAYTLNRQGYFETSLQIGKRIVRHSRRITGRQLDEIWGNQPTEAA